MGAAARLAVMALLLIPAAFGAVLLWTSKPGELSTSLWISAPLGLPFLIALMGGGLRKALGRILFAWALCCFAFPLLAFVVPQSGEHPVLGLAAGSALAWISALPALLLGLILLLISSAVRGRR